MSYRGAIHKERVLAAIGFRKGVMIWNAPSGTFRAPSGALVKVGMLGQADLLGIVEREPWPVPFAVECKAGSGRLSKEQRVWRDNWVRRGGVYLEAREPEGVEITKRNWLSVYSPIADELMRKIEERGICF